MKNKQLLIFCIIVWFLVFICCGVLITKINYYNKAEPKQETKIEEDIPNIIEETLSEEDNTMQLALDICKYYYSWEIADEIFKQCEIHNIPIYVAYALMDSESEMYYKAESKKNCRGLFQTSEGCLEDYNKVHDIKYTFDDMYNIRKNIQVGIWYYQKYRKEVNDDWVQLYAIYNNGLTGYHKYGTANIQSAVNRFSSKLEKMKVYFY